ncbi:hypothetical protein, partial [Streptomyces phaeofaciens]|uniref:hypothetical protein n=1 Tax=Streptomyces phaeofaciens TaxID=68254 RepID=UPI0036963E97
VFGPVLYKLSLASAVSRGLLARYQIIVVELRRHGQQLGRRVTADVVANLADFLRTGTEPERLEALFVPRQLAPATSRARRPRPGAPSSGPANRSRAGSSPRARTGHSKILE